MLDGASALLSEWGGPCREPMRQGVDRSGGEQHPWLTREISPAPLAGGLSSLLTHSPEHVPGFPWMAVTTDDPLHPRDLGDGTGNWAPPNLVATPLIRPASDHGDVWTCEGVDAFEGPTGGAEVPEEAGHGDGESSFSVPGGRQGQGIPPVLHHPPSSRAH
jgi:hypothetical protein